MNCASGKIPLRAKSSRKCKYSVPDQETAKTSCKVWLASAERCRCINKAKTRNPLKFAGMSKTAEPISAAGGPKFTILHVDMWGRYCCLTFSPIVDTCHSCEDTVRQSCAMVRRWRIFWQYFASCIFSKPRAACFRHVS